MTISEVSKKYNITADTIRYYEKEGLIPTVPRNKNGIRESSEEFISGIKVMIANVETGKYLTDKKHLSYPDYEKKIISIMTTKKKKSYAEMAEIGVSVKYDESQGAFTKFLIDIPTNLVSELKKIKE